MMQTPKSKDVVYPEPNKPKSSYSLRACTRKDLHNATLKSTRNRPSAYQLINRYLVDFIAYSNVRIVKMSKFHRREGAASDMKIRMNQMLEITNKLQSYHYKDQREVLCRELDIKLKTFCSIIDLVHKEKAITDKNMAVWIRQAKKVDDVAVFTAMGLQKRREMKKN